MLILAAVAALAPACMSSQPNDAAYKEENIPGDRQRSTVTFDSHDSYNYPEQAPPKPPAEPWYWYTPFKRSDWWLVVVAAVTGGLIFWQAWETKNSVREVRRGIDVSKMKERAKIIIRVEPFDYAKSDGIRVTFDVANVGESGAIFSLALAGIYISQTDAMPKGGSGRYALKITERSLKASKTFKEAIGPAGSFVYTSASTVHFHGRLIFRDAFEDVWQKDFHRIWRRFDGPVYQSWFGEHRNGEWEAIVDETEKRMRIPRPSNLDS